MINGLLEILYLCIGVICLVGLAGSLVGIVYLYEECGKYCAFRVYELFEQHWSGL